MRRHVIPLVIAGALLGSAANAQLRPLSRGAPRSARDRQADRLASVSVRALGAGDFEVALAAADRCLSVAPGRPWCLYDRGAALAALGRVDEAERALARSVAAFPAVDAWGRATAQWRRALVLQQGGRCEEARAAFLAYAAYVGPADPTAASQALARAQRCNRGEEAPASYDEDEGDALGGG